ncbi:MAG: hypothetical protein ACD_51C00183G0007 [uncultured bacterium]|nr:MAG: hypothetical protein ACD_51C00183G0007 [uncultured bacterium]OGJ47517.1 MAG: hypothetical protein A2244_02030 [Candidatus Peregrinibacteria bacterium RIFOXYA2_FULL_41_18]OGJ48938.1 MAG: hypothetical protein A2344_03355 [Candidatus Peregrinibacteria bacterium RIFOXYB12_FULL_41_12]OGJ51488.1 MAG: hypothetical protein A2336_02225 [Candidatus Peregrinibacteria bacterium RIFOXYB2_FULL_41_88]OGJ52593.1 MAG: hypothetical protein A2448_02435 [Candidatus Peregrinibacteria bacterium RIFOXYC2_FULL
MEDDDDDYRPKTIKEAVERFIELWDNADIELLIESPKSYMKFLYSNMEKDVIERCELSKDNLSLLEDCGSPDMPIKEAAHVIIKDLWEEFHS